MITNVYIDGFNLYYGRLKGTPNKWLDLESMCAKMLPQNRIKRIRYFTARVSARPDDPDVAIRQQVYMRALLTLPSVTIHLGHFLVKPTRMPLANPPVTGAKTVAVMKTEEKGSDVNLATYLLADAFRNDADAFVVISNDSDLMEPIRLVRHELAKVVGVLNPQDVQSRALMKAAPTFVKQIRAGVIASSQFPESLVDQYGNTIARPTNWA